MKQSFSSLLYEARVYAGKYDADNIYLLKVTMNALKTKAWKTNEQLVAYHHLLLFISAYPADIEMKTLAESALQQLAIKLKKVSHTQKGLPENEGLPYLTTVTRFSPDCLKWLLEHKDIRVSFDSFYEPTITLAEVLSFTLPSVLRPETSGAPGNEELMEILNVPSRKYLPFLVGQMDMLNDRPFLKESLFEKLGVYVQLRPVNRNFSKAYNRHSQDKVFYHNSLLKQFDHFSLMDTALPAEKVMDGNTKEHFIKVIRNAMALTARETDPTTYMEKSSLRFFELERGISICIYDMIPERQLPLESYVGFTLFKNGFPCSYGGSWVFGHRARFGMNILESFRGGESGYIMCQLLRVYKQVFQITCFEVEPYQFGLDNPDGIKSGAFWFYYRYGFRPEDKRLGILADLEHKKIRSIKGYRSSEKTLLRFTESNLVLETGGNNPPQVADILEKMKQLVTRQYRNDGVFAENECMSRFRELTGCPSPATQQGEQVLKEVALWAAAMKVTDKHKLGIMASMVTEKANDLYRYQDLVRKFLN